MKIRHWTLAVAALLLTGHGAHAQAQKVFRCGPEGRIYSQTPCKDGYEINADDARTAEQRKAAEDNVKREEKMVEKMARERRANEVAAAKQAAALAARPAAIKPAASAASGAAAKRKHPRKRTAQP